MTAARTNPIGLNVPIQINTVPTAWSTADSALQADLKFLPALHPAITNPSDSSTRTANLEDPLTSPASLSAFTVKVTGYSCGR